MNRPELADDINPVAGMAALALFVVLAAVFLTANFSAPEGLPTGVSITASIGYALFDLVAESAIPTEGFLFVFLAIAVVLDAALDGAILLARREDDGETLSDGGQRGSEDR